MSGDSIDEIVKPKMRQAYEADKKKIDLQWTNLAREHPVYLSLNL